MKNYNSLSLKIKIMMLCIGGVLITGLVSLLLIFINFSGQEKDKLINLQTTSESLSEDIQDQFFERYGDVKAFSAHFRNMNTSNINGSDNINYLNQLIDYYGIYNLIMVCDLNGNLLAVNSLSPKGKRINNDNLYKYNYKNTKWFKDVIEKKFLEDEKKGFTNVAFQDPNFSDVIEKSYQNKVFATVFSTFVYNNKGEPIGVLSTHADFYWVESIFIRGYQGFLESSIKTAEFKILNNNGMLIFDYSPFQNNGNKDILHDEKKLHVVNLFKEWDIEKNSHLLNDNHREVDNFYNGETYIQVIKKIVGEKIIDSLGWRLALSVSKDELFSEVNFTKIVFIIAFIILIALTIFISAFLIKNLINDLLDLASKMSQGNHLLKKASLDSSADSQALSAAATEQAASLQETVAAVNEISVMMNKSSEMANLSRKKSDENKEKVREGKNIVNEMLISINYIKQSNDEVLREFFEGNKRISEIVNLISEIENKTKVINEIVFQTKLLSFNASVEAARAGEHGRGFSVVAEEVGNLAKMSGTASTEISTMLDNSLQKVKNIISETKNNIENISKKSENSVKKGEEISTKCANIFEKIYTNSEEVNSLVNEIANSAQEQAKGVQEINTAMNELDSVTHQNSTIAQKSSSTADELLKQSVAIGNVATQLLLIIHGSNSNIIRENISIDNNHDHKPKNSNQNSYKNEKQPIVPTAEKKDNLKKEVPSYNDSRFEEL
jgi:methyl-accepting chemotaxis protein